MCSVFQRQIPPPFRHTTETMKQHSTHAPVKPRILALIQWLDSKPVIPMNVEHGGMWVESDLFLTHHVSEIVRAIPRPKECNAFLDEVARFVKSVGKCVVTEDIIM